MILQQMNKEVVEPALQRASPAIGAQGRFSDAGRRKRTLWHKVDKQTLQSCEQTFPPTPMLEHSGKAFQIATGSGVVETGDGYLAVGFQFASEPGVDRVERGCGEAVGEQGGGVEVERLVRVP